MKTALSHQIRIELPSFFCAVKWFYFKNSELLESHLTCGFKSIMEMYFPVSAHMEGGEMNVANKALPGS